MFQILDLLGLAVAPSSLIAFLMRVVWGSTTRTATETHYSAYQPLLQQHFTSYFAKYGRLDRVLLKVL